MLLNRGTQHSIKIIGYLNKIDCRTNQNAKSISRTLHLPEEYTAKILQTLVKNKIVTSKKGKGGGFTILRSADDILLGEIIDIFNSKHSFVMYYRII